MQKAGFFTSRLIWLHTSVNRGFYIRADVILILLNKLRKNEKMRSCAEFTQETNGTPVSNLYQQNNGLHTSVNRISCMIAYVVLILLNKLRKNEKM